MPYGPCRLVVPPFHTGKWICSMDFYGHMDKPRNPFAVIRIPTGPRHAIPPRIPQRCLGELMDVICWSFGGGLSIIQSLDVKDDGFIHSTETGCEGL